MKKKIIIKFFVVTMSICFSAQAEAANGDVTDDGLTNAEDVVCLIDAVTFALASSETPSCLQSNSQADLNCDGVLNVVDVEILTDLVDKIPVQERNRNHQLCPLSSAIDTDSNCVVDTCEEARQQRPPKCSGTSCYCEDGWRVEEFDYILFNIWGTDDSNVYAVGKKTAIAGRQAGGVILHYDGKSWSEVFSDEILTSSFHAIFGFAEDDIFVTGVEGMLIHYDGEQWTVVEPSLKGFPYWLWDLWGPTTDDLIAVGFGDQPVFHYDGSEWNPILFNDSNIISDSWGYSSSNFYVLTNDSIHHFEGDGWEKITPSFLPSKSGFSYLWGSPGGDLIVTGTFPTKYYSSGLIKETAGLVLKYNGQNWVDLSPEIGGNTILRSIVGDNAEDFFVVGSQVVPSSQFLNANVMHSKIMRYSGGQWIDKTFIKGKIALEKAWLSPEGHLFASGFKEKSVIISNAGCPFDEI